MAGETDCARVYTGSSQERIKPSKLMRKAVPKCHSLTTSNFSVRSIESLGNASLGFDGKHLVVAVAKSSLTD